MKCWPELCSNCESNSWRSWLQLLVKELKISKHLHILFSATPATNGGPAKVSSANANLIDRIENDIHRMRRTIYLLISMGLVFCVCWLPLNIVNLVSLPLYSSLVDYLSQKINEKNYTSNFYCIFYLESDLLALP